LVFLDDDCIPIDECGILLNFPEMKVNGIGQAVLWQAFDDFVSLFLSDFCDWWLRLGLVMFFNSFANYHALSRFFRLEKKSWNHRVLLTRPFYKLIVSN